MNIQLYDRVKLKTGETASIVEIWEAGKAFEADIDRKSGHVETDTVFMDDIVETLPM